MLGSHHPPTAGLRKERLEQVPSQPRIPRGDGYFWAVELVKDKTTRETFGPQERERLVRSFLPGALFENGLYCRPDDRGDVVVQFAPPLIAGPSEFDRMEAILRQTLTEAQNLLELLRPEEGPAAPIGDGDVDASEALISVRPPNRR